MSEHAIREIVDRETRTWDAQDVELLLSNFTSLKARERRRQRADRSVRVRGTS